MATAVTLGPRVDPKATSGIRVAHALACVALALLAVDGVLRLLLTSRGAFGAWIPLAVWLGLYALGYLPGLRRLRPQDERPHAWSLLAAGLLLQALSYVAASMALVRMTLLEQPFVPFRMFQRIPELASFLFAMALLSMFILGPVLGWAALRGARHGKLLFTASMIAAMPFLFVLVAILLHAVGV